ncbi:PucR family transcriptional regulator [Mycolicibacterium senegalense]|uniref:Purine catabolism PurC-like protein n=2 Tax=Mycolicibacterium TaxID=1866885 RepID=A0A378W662_9MYCO|nr:PucR family transcriptional regulator [Mycolicibacterium senegalense]CDP86635.1 purine catabolism PurC-like protein [Mycolicibacterium farcinogenes]MCV7336056.1 PucR family transcriptional regulator ligand-binding domain-containing protein [Mycolicibacterium senegalense]MDR7287938.1 purine catabolism regulator [Mycolicibacterium senegalense]QZA24938.1 PucR family transcriptional regulator ligand-binding domain-containing protein [Mycolicibacterium senegalense]SUA28486.1 purine catabolism Pu
MISVDQLTAVPSLGLRYLAGEGGGSRLVTWAHACDLADPWNWFDSGDLVMTTGGGLPVDEGAQREWITRLIGSKVSALVVAASPTAPAVTRGLIDVAEAQGFPVLAADYELHFVELARTVIESAIESERQRVASIKRLYDVYWQSLHARGTFGERLSALEFATGWALEVRDQLAGELIATGRRAYALAAESSGTEPVHVAIPGAGEVVLVAAADSAEVTDRPLAQHIGGLIALELEHAAAQQDRLRASGEDLLAGLLDESITLSAVWPELRHRGMVGDVVMACWSTPDGAQVNHQAIHRQVCLQSYAPLFSVRGAALVGLVPDEPGVLTQVAAKLAPNCAVGISTRLAVHSHIAEALRQAQLAVARAHDRGLVLSEYGGEDGQDFLPASVEDIRRVVRRCLGPLIDHDRANDGELVESVRVFLRHDGAWQASADALNIHRQTLVYRLKKVEQLTGLKPTTTAGSAMLWLALTAADRAELALEDLVS